MSEPGGCMPSPRGGKEEIPVGDMQVPLSALGAPISWRSRAQRGQSPSAGSCPAPLVWAQRRARRVHARGRGLGADNACLELAGDHAPHARIRPPSLRGLRNRNLAF